MPSSPPLVVARWWLGALAAMRAARCRTTRPGAACAPQLASERRRSACGAEPGGSAAACGGGGAWRCGGAGAVGPPRRTHRPVGARSPIADRTLRAVPSARSRDGLRDRPTRIGPASQRSAVSSPPTPAGRAPRETRVARGTARPPTGADRCAMTVRGAASSSRNSRYATRNAPASGGSWLTALPCADCDGPRRRRRRERSYRDPADLPEPLLRSASHWRRAR